MRWIFGGLKRKPVEVEVEKKRMDYDLNGIPMWAGFPDVGEAIHRANAIYDAGRPENAMEFLEICRDYAIRRGFSREIPAYETGIESLIERQRQEALQAQVLAALQDGRDGIIQIDLYLELDDIDADAARYACWQLAEAGRITREKKGRSYILRLADHDKLE